MEEDSFIGGLEYLLLMKSKLKTPNPLGHFVVVTKISQEKKDTIGLSKKNEYFDTSLAWPKIGNEHIVWYLDPGIDVSRNRKDSNKPSFSYRENKCFSDECCSCLPEFETARYEI